MTRMPLFGKLAFSVLACALLVSAQSFVVKTVAGAKAPVADGINARDAILSYPQSIAVNSAGLVYVADTDNFRIRVIESDNTIRTYLGNGTQKAVPDGASIVGATVGYVTALAFDAQGALYYSELGAVRKVSGARVTTVAGNGIFGMGGENGPALSARIGQILHISFDPLGRMLLSDSYNHKVWRVELDGRIVTVAGSGMPGFSGDGGSAREAKLYFPVAAVGDAAGNTYIADYYNDRIRRVGADGKIATYAGGKDLWQRMNGPATSSYVSPHDLAFNAAGELLVFDGSYFRVISLAGTITTLNYPVRGLQWAISGARYWTVSSGASGQVYSGSIGGGTSTLIAGKQRYGGDGGKALDALLQEPRGLAFDAQGNLFIADTLNHRIRQLDAAGNIKTVAGTGTPGYVPDQSTAISSPVNAPRSMAVCPDNSVYFADSNNGYIRAVDSTGKIRTVAGTGRYATTSYIEGPGPQVPIGFPYALACDAAGNVFFDGNDNLLYRLQPNGQVTILNEFGSFGLSPTARALSFTRGYIDSIAAGKGGVYVAASGLIWRVGPDGKVVTVAGGGAQAPVSGAAGIHAALAGVDSLALDAQENLLFRAWDYFPDSFGLKLMRLEQSGQITVLAGGGTSQADGAPALGTRFSSLNALAIGPQNRIYFEDGSSIRMLEPAVATALVILRGNRQTGVRGGALPEPIVVKATGAGGEGIAGVLVRFAVTRGAAQVFPSSIATDGQGLAAATVTLGVSDTEVEVTASATGLAPVVFNLTALEPRPSSMIAVQGDNQVVSAGAEAPLPLEVLVRNNDNSPAPGVRVNFSIAAGDGTLSAVFAVTGADGRAGVRVTPRLAGTMAIDASSPGLNSVRFTLQVGPPLTLPAVRDYVVSGFAGNPPPMENVPAREAALGAVPKGLAVDGEGALVFSDPERNQILKVAGGVLFVVAGSSGRASAPPPDGENARDATLSSPGAVAVSPEGGIAFVNEGTSSLHRIDKDGALRRIPLRDGIKAGGLGFLPGGLLAVSDMGGHRILGISPDGSIKTLAGTGSAGDSGDDGPATQAGIQSPGALVAAPDGTIYFVHTVDETQSRIRAVLPGGTIKTVAGTGVAGPASDGGHALQASLGAVLALAYARDGSLYLCNSDSIRRVRPDGTIETLRREVYSTGYASLVAAPDGALYMGRWAYEAGWTGQSLARLERITSNGELVTVAGGADLAAGDDGPAAQARLYRPTGLAWSSGGSLLIADPLAARLRAVDAAGVMKTLAGGGTKPPEAVPAAASDVLVLPRLVTAAPNGSIYFISDAAEICTLTRDGTVRTLANVPADLVGVTALASDIFSNLLFIAAHRDGQRILYRLRPSGELAWLAGGGAQAPGGGVRASALNLQTVTALAVSPANDICLADSLAQAIYCFDDQAALRHLAGDPRGVRTDGAPASRYRLDTIQSFAFGPDGDLYVAAATAVVRAKSDGGAAVRIAGSFDQPGESGDGDAAGEARFNRIAALALDPDEIVYVADGMRVRRLAPARK